MLSSESICFDYDSDIDEPTQLNRPSATGSAEFIIEDKSDENTSLLLVMIKVH